MPKEEKKARGQRKRKVGPQRVPSLSGPQFRVFPSSDGRCWVCTSILLPLAFFSFFCVHEFIIIIIFFFFFFKFFCSSFFFSFFFEVRYCCCRRRGRRGESGREQN